MAYLAMFDVRCSTMFDMYVCVEHCRTSNIIEPCPGEGGGGRGSMCRTLSNISNHALEEGEGAGGVCVEDCRTSNITIPRVSSNISAVFQGF